jgi:hypothetical protein
MASFLFWPVTGRGQLRIAGDLRGDRRDPHACFEADRAAALPRFDGATSFFCERCPVQTNRR